MNSYIPYGFQDASRRQGSECSQQRGNLKDNGYIVFPFLYFTDKFQYLTVHGKC
ncbi:hypothetical protein [Photorhabdus sp. RW14-46]|uniref:hypothetical protein n=1 Tax=Photorhabdus sp. RW14-46 TaxID=2100168 RepID=UPI001A97F97B|nr:hypothetical protein [Photorhabdus sp. RW14-46]